MVCLQPSATTSGDQAPFELVGDAPGFKDVVLRLPTIANADGAVLITGETGTGKDLIARAIHGLGPRAARPFVTVRCDTLADSAFEREWIAAAAGGTLFLDEADALSERAQTTLLGMIPNGADRPFGSGDDVRLVAASRSALTVPVRTGRFRADLYYRLSVFSITLPPLRERREDILPLSTHFITKHGAGATAARLAPAAECALMACEWPGNVSRAGERHRARDPLRA
jgi:anaerobic nitric oxide reductase transcription regulator